MNEFNFLLKTNLISKKGGLFQLIDFIKENNFKNVGLIIDKGVTDNDGVNRLEEDLRKTNNINIIKWIYDLPFEPDYDSLDRVKREFQLIEDDGTGILISIGGGSTIDFTKGIATLLTNHGKAIKFRGFPKNLKQSIPVIACPTTAGTASEVTYNAVFTDYSSNKKLGINTTNNFPILSILDSNLIINSPKSVQVSSGLDALVHTFESYACKKSNILTKFFAKNAYKLLTENIIKAILNKDQNAIQNMMLGAYMAGISLFNSGSGPAGAISYPLGVHFKVPHGLGGGIILPSLIKHNIENKYYEYSNLPDTKFLTENEGADHVLEKIEEIYLELDVFKFFTSKYKIDLNESFIKDIHSLKPAFDQNPVDFKPKDAINILKNINNARI